MGPDIASGLQTKVAKLNFTWSLTILTLGFVKIGQELTRLHSFGEERFVLDFKSYKNGGVLTVMRQCMVQTLSRMAQKFIVVFGFCFALLLACDMLYWV